MWPVLAPQQAVFWLPRRPLRWLRLLFQRPFRPELEFLQRGQPLEGLLQRVQHREERKVALLQRLEAQPELQHQAQLLAPEKPQQNAVLRVLEDALLLANEQQQPLLHL